MTKNYRMYADFRADPSTRIREALRLFAQAEGRPATLVLVAKGEAADIAGVEVREPREGEGVVAKGVVWVGGE